MAVRRSRKEVFGIDAGSCVGAGGVSDGSQKLDVSSPLDDDYIELSAGESEKQTKKHEFGPPALQARDRVRSTLFMTNPFALGTSGTSGSSGSSGSSGAPLLYWRVLRRVSRQAGSQFEVQYVQARALTEMEKAEEERLKKLDEALENAPDAVKNAWFLLLDLTIIPTLVQEQTDGRSAIVRLSSVDSAKLDMGTDLYDVTNQKFVKLDPSSSEAEKKFLPL
jgi:hypothetical protein